MTNPENLSIIKRIGRKMLKETHTSSDNDKSIAISVEDLDIIKHIKEKMSKEAKARSDELTPDKAIKSREGKGGKTWRYAKADYFEDCLNRDFPGWSFEVKKWEIVGNKDSGFVVADVKLTVVDNTIIRIMEDVGGAEIKYYADDHKTRAGDYLNIPNDVKAAATDGLKRCSYRLGYSRDLKYDPADLDITEEQYGEIQHALHKIKEIKPETFDKIMDIVYRKVNQANYNNFMKKQILPIIEKIDPITYDTLSHVYGKPKEEKNDRSSK